VSFREGGPPEKLLSRACAAIDTLDLSDLLVRMVRIPSPTGHEEALARFLVGYLESENISAEYQAIAEGRGNALGRLLGDGRGPRLLLYAPIDTHLLGRPADDRWSVEGSTLDLAIEPTLVDDHVIGLGAENPKAFAACVVGAMVAIARSRIPLSGELEVGLVAGGMPDAGDPMGDPKSIGLGFGGEALLRHLRPDFAIIAKGGWAVSAGEPGLCWIRVTVHGLPGYVGTRHMAPYRNAVVDAARVIEHIERWLPDYTAAHRTPSVAPQGLIGAVAGGSPRKPAFVPAVCELYIDLRVAPGDDPASCYREFESALDRLRIEDPELRITSELLASLPPEETPSDSWIIRASERAWEAIEGQPHKGRTGASGVTDALVLRRWHIPTAKIGLERDPSRPKGFENFTLGVVSLRSMKKLVQLLVRVIVETCIDPGPKLA
jgi:acetylornithine deacetylase/succinyl-diaminopimelate desuccinylase-like protein